MTTPHPLSPRADCARHVSTQARLMTAAAAVFGLWQFAWLAREAEHLEQVLPTPWSVEFWMAAWIFDTFPGTPMVFPYRLSIRRGVLCAAPGRRCDSL